MESQDFNQLIDEAMADHVDEMLAGSEKELLCDR